MTVLWELVARVCCWAQPRTGWGQTENNGLVHPVDSVGWRMD